MNLGDIRTRVRIEAGETSAGFWTNDQIDNYINAAARQFSSDTGIIIAQPVETNIVSGSIGYKLPTDCPGPHAILAVFQQTTQLDPTDIQAILRSGGNPHVDTGTPEKWHIITSAGDVYLALYRIPDSNVTDGLKIWHWKLAVEMTADANECEVPEDFIKGVIYEATRYVFVQKRELEISMTYHGLYLEEVARAQAYVEVLMAAGLQDRDARRGNVGWIF